MIQRQDLSGLPKLALAGFGSTLILLRSGLVHSV